MSKVNRRLKLTQQDDPDYPWIDQDGCSWDSIENWFFTGILNGCGCGRSEEIAKRALKLFENFALVDKEWDKRFRVEKLSDEILAHWFDSLGLTEHGGSVYGSWLTNYGERVLAAIVDAREQINSTVRRHDQPKS